MIRWFCLFLLIIQFSYSAQVQQLAAPVRSELWQRYFSWLHTNFKLNSYILKENIQWKQVLQASKTQHFWVGFAMNEPQRPDIISFDAPETDIPSNCNFYGQSESLPHLLCQDADKSSWQIVQCPRNIKVKQMNFPLSFTKKCFQNRNLILAQVSQIRSSLFKLLPNFNIIQEHIKEFQMQPTHILWNQQANTIKVYYN